MNIERCISCGNVLLDYENYCSRCGKQRKQEIKNCYKCKIENGNICNSIGCFNKKNNNEQEFDLMK